MANMNPDELEFVEGFFVDRSMVASGKSLLEPNRERSSPNELSMNLTITSRDSHRRSDRRRDEIKEVSAQQHLRTHKESVSCMNALDVANNELEKFNSWVKAFEKKGASIVAVLDRMGQQKDNECNLLREQAYNDIQLLGQEVKQHHRQQHFSSKEVCGRSNQSTQIHVEKLKQEVDILRSANREKEAEIERHANIIKQMQDELGEKENLLAATQEKLEEQKQMTAQCNDKLQAAEVAAAVEIMSVLAEKNVETASLNQEVRMLADKITEMYKEIEQTNLQKSTLMSQTKNLEHKLSQLTESSNNRAASASKNLSIGEFTMRHLSFSIDPTEQDLNEWVHIFEQYYRHYNTKSNEEAADFLAKKGKKMTVKDKEGSEYAICKGYFQKIIDLLKSMQTVKERFSGSRPEQKSPMKELQLQRNTHNTSSDVLLCAENKLKKNPAVDMELQMCKRSLESMKKQCQQLQQENCNLTETIEDLKKQLEFNMCRKQEDSVLAPDDTLLLKLGEYEGRIKEYEEERLKQDLKFKKFRILVKQQQETHLKEKNELTQRCNSLQLEAKQLRYHMESEFLARRKLHNQLEDIKGNIRVYCRIRPLIPREVEKKCAVRVTHNHDTVTAVKDRPFSFHYDAVFGPESSQEEVFDETKKMVQSAFDGYNVCIFAYGQTGSGKTYTMHGNGQSEGLTYRSIKELYSLIEKNHQFCNIVVEMQMAEIYLDSVYDLLGSSHKPLQVYEDKDTKEIIVKDAYRIKVKQAEELLQAYSKGLANRKVSHTQMNNESSRSHLLFMVRIEVEFKEGKDRNKRRGMLNIIDLAGSEKASKAGLKDAQNKESVAINNSLMCLGRVLTALNNKDPHIPYRESKLTYLLRDSLGGNSKTLMFVNVSPADYNISETITSLTFARNVKSIERGHAQINIVRQRTNSEEDQRVGVRRPLSRPTLRPLQE